MTVLAKEGRWLKVRVPGRTGYVPRSKVDMPDDEEIARNTRRRPFVDGRSTKRGFGGEHGPDDRVGADATGDVASSAGGDDDDSSSSSSDDDDGGGKKTHAKKSKGDDDDSSDDDDGGSKKTHAKKSKGDDDDSDDSGDTASSDGDDAEPDDSKTEEPEEDDCPRAHVGKKTKILAERDKDSDTQFVARPNDVLYPTDQKGKWTFVENDEGDSGWILTSQLDDDGGSGGSGKRIIDARARIGLTFIQQGMRTVGSTFAGTGFNPDNYNLGTSALALSLAGSFYKPYKKDYILGADLSYTYAKTVFGGVFADADGMGGSPGVNIGMALHQVDVRLAAGKDLHKSNGMAIFGRLGYRYQGFLIDDVTSMTKNPVHLPSEVFKSPTIGAMLAIPKLTDKLGLKVALDAAVIGRASRRRRATRTARSRARWRSASARR